MGSDASNSGRDPLTALLDRQAFWKSIQHRPPEWLPAWRLGLAFIDLDRLKGFNEAHGQAMGDAALQCVARAITSPLRPYEWASRYGGDEFAVLLALGDRSEAVVWADATRSRIVAATTEEFATGLDVRVGIAVGSAGWWPSDIYTEAILPADAALGDAVRNEPPRRVVVQDIEA